MALLLCIDTSTTHASVALAKDGVLIGMKANQNQRDHASFLQPAVHSLLQEANQTLKDLDAIAVTSGPGSYTGLRVGFASAKGLARPRGPAATRFDPKPLTAARGRAAAARAF